MWNVVFKYCRNVGNDLYRVVFLLYFRDSLLKKVIKFIFCYIDVVNFKFVLEISFGVVF